MSTQILYTRLLGVQPLLSVRGHTTLIGGSRMPAEVLRAMAEANDYFVDMHELNAAAGRRIAEVMKAEAALGEQIQGLPRLNAEYRINAYES